MMEFIIDIKSKIDSNVPLLKEAIIFAKDTKELFIDVDYRRIKIDDINTVTTRDELDDIVPNPMPGKFYYVEEEKIFYRYTINGWEAKTTTYEQYLEFVDLYGFIAEEIYVDYTLLASEWNNDTYSISDIDLFRTDCTIRLMPGADLTEDQQNQLSGAKILVDGLDSNNFLMLRATGDIPTIDIPIIITFNINIHSLNVVEDNLISESKINMLSANQGRVLNEKIGDLNNLVTTDKSSLVGAINEIYNMSR